MKFEIEAQRLRLLGNPEGSRQYILNLYEYDEKKVQEAVDILEEWIKKQNHFLKIDYPRKYLENNILGSKGSIERAKSKLDRLFSLRTVLPQYFTFQDIKKDFKDMFLCSVVIPMPILTDEHYRICIFKMVGNDIYDKVPYLDYYKMLILCFEYFKMYDCSDGYRIVADFRDISITKIITRINPVEMKQFTTLLFDGFGARIKGIHIITPSKTVETLLKIVKPFFKPKVAARFQVHETVESFHEVVPKNILPKDLGGPEGTYREIQEDWTELLNSEESLEFFREMNKAKVNEAYRQNELKNGDMGLPGTFRTLSVD